MGGTGEEVKGKGLVNPNFRVKGGLGKNWALQIGTERIKSCVGKLKMGVGKV